MLSSDVGIKILNGMFGLLDNAQIVFDGEIYIGLFTTLPDKDGLNFTEPADVGYLRIRLDTTSRIDKKSFIGPALAEENVTDGDPIAAYVTNQSLIMFPESSVVWGNIVGFGLFRSANTTSGSTPFLWGEVTSADGESGVAIDQYEVPIIRPGGFRISLV